MGLLYFEKTIFFNLPNLSLCIKLLVYRREDFANYKHLIRSLVNKTIIVSRTITSYLNDVCKIEVLQSVRNTKIRRIEHPKNSKLFFLKSPHTVASHNLVLR